MLVQEQIYTQAYGCAYGCAPTIIYQRSDQSTTLLIARKAGKLISPGQTVTLQVRNSNNSLSNEFQFTRALE